MVLRVLVDAFVGIRLQVHVSALLSRSTASLQAALGGWHLQVLALGLIRLELDRAAILWNVASVDVPALGDALVCSAAEDGGIQAWRRTLDAERPRDHSRLGRALQGGGSLRPCPNGGGIERRARPFHDRGSSLVEDEVVEQPDSMRAQTHLLAGERVLTLSTSVVGSLRSNALRFTCRAKGTTASDLTSTAS